MNTTSKQKLKDLFMHSVHCYREGQGFTQEQMAETLEISARAYAKLEHGVYCCSATSLMSFLLQLPAGDAQSFIHTFGALISEEKQTNANNQEATQR